MSDKAGGRVVFVGNIPYDQSEEQIMDVFQSVGPVANFKFVFDKETGRPKGFGFVEYHDSETAASAVRNLNNYELNSRPLRVDFSHETSIGPGILTSGKDSLASSLPVGTPPPPNLSTPEAISQTLSSFTPPQMLNILQELKSASAQNPPKVRELLKSSPQLSYAVVQSMLLMGLIDASAVASAVDQTQLAAQKLQQQRILQQQQQQQQQQLQAEYTPAPASSNVSIPSHIDPQKAALIKQVMNLTDEQIANLPEAQKTVLLALREKIRRGEFDLV
ncbi:uncharacterized protein V2V93DRAFT_366386 [Kockiozyma suomiensis]|uniref:uncharacterized protein n=1 Tax=Kockiozyma suomiensis TaxID=1337062 RepID=UPI003343CED8